MQAKSRKMIWNEIKLSGPGRYKLDREKSLARGEAGMDIFRHTPGFKYRKKKRSKTL